MTLGAVSFLLTLTMVVIVMELSSFFEEVLVVRLELRRGFTGTKTTLSKIFSRHALKLLRMEGSWKDHLAAGAKCSLIFVAIGMLPLWNGDVLLPISHSLWIFIGLMLLAPTAHLVAEWLFKRGSGWPAILTSMERSIGSATVLFILSITLVAMTGTDTFSEMRSLQLEKSWLIVHNPLSIPLLVAYAVVNLFSSFQTIFSRTGDERPYGWGFNDLIPALKRTAWSLFIADIFLGGSDLVSPLGDVSLVFKAVIINVASALASRVFFQLREDQAEAFILWRLAPISILILAVCLFFPGGLT